MIYLIYIQTNNSFHQLQDDISQCRLCRQLFGFEPRPIVHGKHNSIIMQISQAPSIHVHQTGIPFNDASGKKLRNQWYQITDEIFYNKNNFYIVSVAHCYPGKDPKGGDRLPPAVCAKTWLAKLIPLVNNEIYIIVGSKAASFLFPKQAFHELVFNDQILYGKPAFVIPHPSPRNVKWFLDHPQFESRLAYIREKIHEQLFQL